MSARCAGGARLDLVREEEEEEERYRRRWRIEMEIARCEHGHTQS